MPTEQFPVSAGSTPETVDIGPAVAEVFGLVSDAVKATFQSGFLGFDDVAQAQTELETHHTALRTALAGGESVDILQCSVALAAASLLVATQSILALAASELHAAAQEMAVPPAPPTKPGGGGELPTKEQLLAELANDPVATLAVLEERGAVQ